MANMHGSFIWYDLSTPDVDAAAEFYGAVVGWTAERHASDDTYRQWRAGDTHVGGLMAQSPEAGRGRPGWLGYIGVDDVDATARAAEVAGGSVLVPPTDIPGVGRFARLADPQGGVFYVMRGSVEGSSRAFEPAAIGHCGWNELVTDDPAAALEFYCGLFGWDKGVAMPMGAMGDYQLLTLGGEDFGALMPRPPDAPPTGWNFYFQVPDIDAATETAKARGAKLLHGPAEVPGGVYIIQAVDPFGAAFSLLGRKVDRGTA
ncbi:MAG: VOC family protein [Deltaproteobacteria bacterium]|nr:VOC family protein [Deltaproteobacteria bacterium]